MTVEDIVEKIRSGKQGREAAIRAIYSDQKLKNGVGRVVKNILGSHEYLEDIFNLTLVQMMKNVMKNPKFEIDTNLNSYLFGVSRYLCLAKLREKNKTFATVHEEFEMISDEVTIDLQIINTERRITLHRVLKQLGTKCKEVLLHWAGGFSMRETAKILGYASEGVARKKKHSCMKALTVFMNDNPDIKKELS